MAKEGILLTNLPVLKIVPRIYLLYLNTYANYEKLKEG